ncbi:MAG: sensor histidine kinase [Chloroflexota bacterium]|nr:sensor histidine kinase [Chloroflexota bacterium]
MTWLRGVLAAHHLVLALLHGQAFFVLGLSIVFLARRSARLEVARGLSPLAAFGFCEALVAWSPVLLGPASASMAVLLAWLRLLLLGVGYASLLAFALQTRVLLEKRQWEWWVFTGGFFGLWLIGLVIARLARMPLEQVWLGGEIAARYGLALPGGLLGAWGLCRQTYRTIEPERLPLVKPSLRVTWFALGFFALFGGLIGPAAPFFPANWLNQDVLLRATGIPVSLFRGLCGIATTCGIVRALSVVLSEVDLWLESVERRQALASERERIGRELHDGIIQSIYAAGLMLEGARHSIPDEPEMARAHLTRAIGSLNQTIQDIRRYIFDLRGEMLDDDLEVGLNTMLKDFRVNTLLETELIVEGQGTRGLGVERRQHIFQIASEALTNVARHAQARRVEVCLRYGVNALQLRISDDGVGLSALPINGGHGLRNIRERTRLLDGLLDINTAPNEGMTLILTVPY